MPCYARMSNSLNARYEKWQHKKKQAGYQKLSDSQNISNIFITMTHIHNSNINSKTIKMATSNQQQKVFNRVSQNRSICMHALVCVSLLILSIYMDNKNSWMLLKRATIATCIKMLYVLLTHKEKPMDR